MTAGGPRHDRVPAIRWKDEATGTAGQTGRVRTGVAHWAEPKALRYRLLYTAARNIRGRRRLKIRIPTKIHSGGGMAQLASRENDRG